MKKIIYFDWDGTLYSKEVSQTANTMRGELIQKDINKEELIRQQHNNDNNHYAFMRSLIKSTLNLKNDKSAKIFHTVLFGYFYNKITSQKPEKYCLIDFRKLRKLKKEYNCEFVIITSLWSGTIEGIMNSLNKENLFDRVYTVDITLSGNKKNFISKDILENKNSKPILMIGDRGDDIEAGQLNNLKTIFCNYGHGTTNEATLTINKPQELIPAIERLLKEN